MSLTERYPLSSRDEASEGYTYHHHWEVLSVADANAGPCEICDRPMVRLVARMHVNHNGYKYGHTMDFIYTHADGAGQHEDSPNRPKTHCPKCKAWGTLTTQQQAYGDRTDCSACDYTHWYDIGD